MKTRILVVGAPIGGGHMAAARTIGSHFQNATPSKYSVAVEDIGSVLHLGRWCLGPVLERAYRWGITACHGRPQQLVYAFADSRPRPICRAFRAAFRNQILDWVLGYKPDLVISTFHILSFVLASLLRPFDIPVISVVTDVGRVNRLWLAGPVNHLIFLDRRAAQFAIEAGVTATRLSTIEGVVDPDLSTIPSKVSARRQLGLKNRFTVLVSAGVVGYGPRAVEFVRRLQAQVAPVQLLLAPGRNKRLKTQFEAHVDNSARFIDPEASLLPYMAAADLILGKAGWLTLAEAYAIGRPVLILDCIRGQEEENALVATSTQSARIVTPKEAVHLVHHYAVSPASLEGDFPRLRSKPRHLQPAAAVLADVVEQVLYRDVHTAVR